MLTVMLFALDKRLLINRSIFHQIHILNIIRCNHANSSAGMCKISFLLCTFNVLPLVFFLLLCSGGGDVLVWSTPRLSFVPAGLRPARAIPGRCHR